MSASVTGDESDMMSRVQSSMSSVGTADTFYSSANGTNTTITVIILQLYTKFFSFALLQTTIHYYLYLLHATTIEYYYYYMQ